MSALQSAPPATILESTPTGEASPEEPHQFDLRQLIRDVAESIEDPSPHAVAAATLDKVADEDLRDALAETLGDYCRAVLGRTTLRRLYDESPMDAGPVSSRKSAAAAWLRSLDKHLRDRVNVGTVTAPEWKFLGQCTRDDLLYAAGIRRRLADENTAAAGWYERLAEEMARAKAPRVADLVGATA